MTSENIEAVNATIDWLTMTFTSDNELSMITRLNAHNLLVDIANEGYVLKQGGLMGYRGSTCDGSFVGTLDDRTLCVFTGARAHRAFLELYHPSFNVSRIDPQVTIKYVDMPSNLHIKEYKRANAANDLLPESRRRKIDIIIGNDGGGTLYIGAPSSKQRGLIYNKEVQSKDKAYNGCWRYEARLRDDICDKWLPVLYNSGNPTPDVILAVVAQFFTERGVSNAVFRTAERVSSEPIATIRSDVTKKLQWLQNQVVASVNWLCDEGYEYDVRELFWRITNDNHYPSCPLAEYRTVLDKVW